MLQFPYQALLEKMGKLLPTLNFPGSRGKGGGKGLKGGGGLPGAVWDAAAFGLSFLLLP